MKINLIVDNILNGRSFISNTKDQNELEIIAYAQNVFEYLQGRQYKFAFDKNNAHFFIQLRMIRQTKGQKAALKLLEKFKLENIHPFWSIEFYLQKGTCEWNLGLLHEARNSLEKSYALAKELNYFERSARALYNLACVYDDLGFRAEYESHIKTLNKLCIQHDIKTVRPLVSYALSIDLFRSAKYNEAITILLKADSGLSEMGPSNDQLILLEVLAKCYLRNGDFNNFTNTLDKLKTIAKKRVFTNWKNDIYYLEFNYFIEIGKINEAQKLLTKLNGKLLISAEIKIATLNNSNSLTKITSEDEVSEQEDSIELELIRYHLHHTHYQIEKIDKEFVFANNQFKLLQINLENSLLKKDKNIKENFIIILKHLKKHQMDFKYYTYLSLFKKFLELSNQNSPLLLDLDKMEKKYSEINLSFYSNLPPYQLLFSLKPSVNLEFCWEEKKLSIHNLTYSITKIKTLHKLLYLFIQKRGLEVDREIITNFLWTENYNPLIHDSRISGLISELRHFIVQHGGDKHWLIGSLNNNYTLLKNTTIQKSESKEEKLEDFLATRKNQSRIYAKDLVFYFSYTPRQAQRDILDLEKKNLIQIYGQKKSRYFVIK